MSTHHLNTMRLRDVSNPVTNHLEIRQLKCMVQSLWHGYDGMDTAPISIWVTDNGFCFYCDWFSFRAQCWRVAEHEASHAHPHISAKIIVWVYAVLTLMTHAFRYFVIERMYAYVTYLCTCELDRWRWVRIWHCEGFCPLPSASYAAVCIYSKCCSCHLCRCAVAPNNILDIELPKLPSVI